jgi:Met-zincin
VRALLAARGRIEDGGALPRAYIGEALKALVMHEVGHTLGLRHNFRGSAGISAEDLSDRDHTAMHGHGVSVMDYSPPALALDGRRQGHYFSPTVGSYDRWAVSYGYSDVPAGQVATAAAGRAKGSPGMDAAWTPELELNGLRAIAGAAAYPAHLFASDEDAGFGIYGLDPSVSRYDQTDDPLRWAAERVALIDGLFDSLDTRTVAPGDGYGRLRSAFTDLLTDRWYALLVTTKYIGGAVTARDHAGDPGARPPIATVPVERQRAALGFIAQAGFGEQAYRFRPELLSRLGPDRWMHWGASPTAGGRGDFPLHDWAATQQASLLGQILDPAALARIRDAELRARPGEETLGIPELFTTLTDAIWAEAGPVRTREPARNVGSVRRDLQRLHLNSLVRMVVSPAAGTPEDARAVARVTLSDLATRLDRALSGNRTAFDGYTRAHLTDSRERIAQALAAPMLQVTSTAR